MENSSFLLRQQSLKICLLMGEEHWKILFLTKLCINKVTQTYFSNETLFVIQTIWSNLLFNWRKKKCISELVFLNTSLHLWERDIQKSVKMRQIWRRYWRKHCRIYCLPNTKLFDLPWNEKDLPIACPVNNNANLLELIIKIVFLISCFLCKHLVI